MHSRRNHNDQAPITIPVVKQIDDDREIVRALSLIDLKKKI